MALNILKLTAIGRLTRQKSKTKNGRKAKIWLYVHFQLSGASFVTAPPFYIATITSLISYMPYLLAGIKQTTLNSLKSAFEVADQ